MGGAEGGVRLCESSMYINTIILSCFIVLLLSETVRPLVVTRGCGRLLKTEGIIHQDLYRPLSLN